MSYRWYDNEDAGDCGMMNAADASEHYYDDSEEFCPECGRDDCDCPEAPWNQDDR